MYNHPFPRPKNELLYILNITCWTFLLDWVHFYWRRSDLLCIHCHDTMTNTITNCKLYTKNHQISKEKISFQHTPTVLWFCTWNLRYMSNSGFFDPLKTCILTPNCPFWSPQICQMGFLVSVKKGSHDLHLENPWRGGESWQMSS